MFGGIPGDRYGRRASLRMTGVLYLVSALGCAFALNWYSFVIVRGSLEGWASALLPCSGPCTSRRSPRAKARGRLVGFFQFNVVFGILVGVPVELPDRHHGVRRCGMALETGYRRTAGRAVLPAAVHHSRKPALAGAAGPGPGSARRAPRHRRRELSNAIWPKSWPRWNRSRRNERAAVFSASTGCPIFLAISIGMFNQLSGINAILYYLNDIFAKAGFTKYRATCKPWRWARPTCCSPCSRCP